MKIRKLVKDIPGLTVKGSKEVEVTGVCANSQIVGPGNLFVAKMGRSYDGSRFIPDAVAAGAVAILTDMFDPSLKHVVQLIHPDIAKMEVLLTARFYGNPSERLFTVGITGTNGKTTTATLVKHLLDEAKALCGLIGTIEYIIGPHRHQASRTTPDLCSNQKMLAEMLREHCQAAVMEVTSHALDQGRVERIFFDVAVFTNLTAEHLDYHETMEKYAEAKQRLFLTLSAKGSKKPVAVVNRDCPWHLKVIEGCPSRILTYGLNEGADIIARDVSLTADGSSFTVSYQDEEVEFKFPLAGRFNVYNALAAIGVGIAKGLSLNFIAHALSTFKPVPGRLEPVQNDLGLKIYVDFAHKTDALDNTLSTLMELKVGKLITIFGCGGDRDRGKRPKMAEVSEKWSDFTIVTSDNPRSEKPEEICNEIVKGFSPSAKYVIEIDRRKAIQKAIQMAKPNDIIVIAGKGHETHQIFAHQTFPFSDSAIAKELCSTQRKESNS